MMMASETNRQNARTKVPVALPRNEPDSASNQIPRDAVFRAVIGARIRVTTTAPNQSTEGTIFTADPISNFLVLCTSPSQTSSSTSTVTPGSYRFIQISTISSFQLLTLPQSLPSPQTLQLDPSSLDTRVLNRRLTATVSKLSAAETRRGPKGTPSETQDIFEALSRSHPMRWHGSSGAMLFSDEYLIEKPYGPDDCSALEGRGSVQGLERLKKVLKMEKEKIALKSSARQIDGKMMGSSGKENRPAGLGVAAGSMRKGG